MSETPEELVDRLRSEWCAAFDAEVLRDGTVTFSSPFVFPDGDGFPLLLRRVGEKWELSDGGVTSYQFLTEDFQLTEARSELVERFADSFGYVFKNNVLTRELDDAPGVEDVADLLSLVSQVYGVPVIHRPREAEQIFRTRAIHDTRRLLARPDLAETNWKPERNGGQKFPADLHIPSQARPVVAFYAANSEKAERSVNFITQYDKWGLAVQPLLVHPRGLSSDVIYRAQTVIGDDHAVVEVNEDSQIGYAPLRTALQSRGVSVAA